MVNNKNYGSDVLMLASLEQLLIYLIGYLIRYLVFQKNNKKERRKCINDG